MQKVNHPLKARMYIGGLKSLLIDIVNDIEEIEKTGGVSGKFVETLVDVKSAIDLTLTEFKKVTVRCCDHGESHDSCDASCHDGHDCSEDCDEEGCAGRVEDDEGYCSECDELEDECVCDFEEEDLPPPPPPTLKKGKLPPIKPVKAVKVAATKKKGS